MSTAAVTIVFFYACGCVCVRERVKENRSKTKITRKVNRRDVTKISVKLLTKKKNGADVCCLSNKLSGRAMH